MALTEQVVLDIQSAQRQIDALERQIEGLGTPINVPVNISGADAVDRVGRDFRQADDAVDDLNRELDETERSLRQVEGAADRGTQGVLRFGTRGASVFTNLRGSILGVVGAFGAIQGARALFDFFGTAIEAASDLEESTSKVNVVFGNFADEIEEFASTGPQALGLANAAALEFTGTFGNLFVALGLTQREAADLAPEIVQLGADLASFNNIEVTEALDKLRAGLVGEAEPLRALGVNLTAATTEAKAFELGLVDASGVVSEAAKVQARYALILEQTATAQGDFARTSDGIANRQRTLAAEFENTRAAVGEALLPAFELLLEIAPQITDAIESGLVPALASLSASIGSVDTSAITQFLGGAPSAASQLGTQFSSASQAIGNALQVFSALSRLEFGDVGVQFQQLGDDIQRFREAPIAGDAIRNLISTIQGGAEPTRALESTLLELGDSVSGLTLETFEDLAEQLLIIATVSGATPGDLNQLADTLRDLGEGAGFSAEGVDIIVAALRGPFAQAMAEASVGDIIAANLAGTLGDLGEAARGSSPEIARFGEVLSGLDFEADISRIRSEFDRLPDGLDAAQAAMKTEEDEITEDWAGFLSDLTDELARVEAFRSDVEVLRAFGLDRLADAIEAEGISAADVASGAVDNIAQAIEANDALEQAADREAAAFRQRLADAIAQGTLDLTIPVNVIAAIQSLVLEGLGGQQAAEIVGAAGAGPNVGGGVTVNNTQNFEGFTPSTPDLVRANQAIGQITVN